MQAAPAYFVHAMGRGGGEAWPRQADHDFGRPVVFLERRGWGDDDLPTSYTAESEAAWLASELGGPVHVVGHSWSGLVVLELALRYPSLVRSLILCEPAAFGVAADDPTVRDHQTAMAPAFEAGLSLEAFASRFNQGLGGVVAKPDEWSPDDRFAWERLRRHAPPWSVAIDDERLRELSTPTLVLSSGGAGFYDAVARRLGEFDGVRTETIEGPPHRPQDTERFNSVAVDWWRSVERAVP